MNIYKKIFYNFYSFFIWIGKDSEPAFKAILFLSVIDFLYLANLDLAFNLIDIKLLRTHNSKYYGLVYMVPFLILNYVLFSYRDKYEEIYATFNKSNPPNDTKSKITTVIFVIAPFVGLIILIYLNRVKLGVIGW